jgi:hypothetical protein
MSEVAKGVEHSGARKMLEWAVAKTSKLRFTAHGDGEGNLETEAVNDFGAFNESMSADCIAKWLNANGLVRAGNLKTISVNICMAAKHNLNAGSAQERSIYAGGGFRSCAACHEID